MATGSTVDGVFTPDDEKLDEFRIKYSKWLGRFECPWEKWRTPSSYDLLQWKFYAKDNSNIPEVKELNKLLPIMEVKEENLLSPPEDKIQVTWIGHATLLVQFDGITILTDPVFGKYCGPKLLGRDVPLSYKRYREAACQVKDFPHLDAVIVSHDHFDHLDSQSAGEISKKFPDVKWFVGKESRDLCQMKKEENITDLLWWQEKTIEIKGKRFTFACTPAQHWCRRSAFDMNKRLWCSWVVKGPTKSFFFAGDTGYYEPVFKKIGEKYGPFALSAIPIGCIEPREILKYQHVNPEEAVKIHYDVKSEMSISIHWGAYTMTNEFYLDPPHLLEACMKEDKDKFISLQHGETWIVGSPRERPKFMDAKQGNSDANGGNENSNKANKFDECEEVQESENSGEAKEGEKGEQAQEGENSEKAKEGETSEKAKEGENSERENSAKAMDSEISEKAKGGEKREQAEEGERAKGSENCVKAIGSENSEKAKGGENSEKEKEAENSEKAKEGENSEKAKEGENSERENSAKAMDRKISEKAKGDEKSEQAEEGERAKGSENCVKAIGSENSEQAKGGENSEQSKGGEKSEQAKEVENSENANAREKSEIEKGESK